MKNVLVVFNVNAGRKQAIKFKKIIHKFLIPRCHKFKFISIDEFESVDIDFYDTIIVMGGDGTVNKVASFVSNTDKTLGIIPTGTANLLAAKLGLSLNLKKTLKLIDKGKTKLIDILIINDKHCVLRCGLGYDSDIICKTPQSLKNRFGYFAYFISGIIFAFKLTPMTYEISYDGQNNTITSTCIIFANAANMYQNIVSIANKSSLEDNLMDIFILKTINPFVFFYELIRIIFGIRKNSKRALYFKTKSMKIKNNWSVCHIDGEKYNLKGDINIDILPKALKVFSK